MGKFLNAMSQSDTQVLRTRATALNQQADIAQTNIINALKQRKSELELEIQNLTDFAPESTQSLRPGVSGWDPRAWATSLQNAKMSLYKVTLELKIAEDTYNEFFGEEAAE